MATLDSQVSEVTASSVDDSDPDDYDNDLDYYDNDDIVDYTTTQSLSDPEWYSYKCFNYKEVWSIINDQILSLSSSINIDYSTTLSLLQCNHWNLDIIYKKLQNNSTLLLKESCDLPINASIVENSTTCMICFMELSNNGIALKCQHVFCSDCLLTYLKLQITNGKSLGIKCMQCDVLVAMDTVEMLIKSFSDIYTRYWYLKLTEIALSHRDMRWCPGIDCDIIFVVEDPQAKRVTCSSCDTSLCFLCGEEYHCPTDCEAFKIWLTKCQDDSETFNYISANTKDCPKCHTSIEKNGGCNHINCSLCSHDFCWMCLGDWAKHCGEYYECSRYKADPDKYKDTASEQRFALQKYLFYYERWKNHTQSLLLEEQTRMKIQDHIEKRVKEGEGTWIDWQYLLDAAVLVIKCRYTLKYTYPRAYWMEVDKELFEYQQSQLELEIENLSWKVERATITDRADLEQQMSVTEIRRTTLLRDFKN